MVPYLQLISLVPVTLLCLVMSVDGTTDFWGIWLSAMAVYVVVQCIQDFFLTPKIMGKAMGLNPCCHPSVTLGVGHTPWLHRSDYSIASHNLAAGILRCIYHFARG